MTPKKAIEILTKHADSFLSGTDKCFFVTPQDEQDLLDACQIATDALRKTIPVQPVPGPGIVSWETRCPVCNALLYDFSFDFDTNWKSHVGFCIYCGQRFTKPDIEVGRWEDVEYCEEMEDE